MFKALEIGSTIDLDPRQLASLDRSSNTQQLALGGGSKKPTRAYVLSFFDARSDAYRVYVFLARLERERSGRPAGLLFRSDPDNVPLHGYEALRREAAAMVQSQGFHMERVDLDARADDDRAALVAHLPFATPAHPSPPPPVLRARDSTAGSAIVGPASQVTAGQLPDVSREISLPGAHAVQTLGKLLSLF